MTILETSERLIQWFSKHDSFDFDSNYKEIFALHITETPESDKAALQLGLDELVKSGFIKHTVLDNKSHWILIKPIDMCVQTLSFSTATAFKICSIIQMYSTSLGHKTKIKANPLNLQENDILYVLQLLMETINLSALSLPDKIKPKNKL
jgi:hypothetical protein